MSEENINQEELQETTASIGPGSGDSPAEETIIDNLEPLQEDELTALKKRATLLGIQFHPAIGLEKLRDKVAIKLRGASETEVTTDAGLPEIIQIKPLLEKPVEYTPEELIAGYAADQANLSPSQRRNQAIKDANKLVRIRVTCMNPNKRDWAGEVLTVSNSIVGTFKKYVPFNATEGWHVPQIIYQALKERKCQVFVNGKNAQGITIKKPMLIAEFGIEVLPPLSVDEIKELGQRQLMASGAQ